ncbi:MAG: SH3 domain protein [Planctomycetota bacterium]|jgi:SH3 domain protein
MNLFRCTQILFAFAALTMISPFVTASTKYITDEFEVTLRSGTSTSNSIVRMLSSGDTVTLLEQNLASKYSLVETTDQKKGYILSRFLVDTVPAKDQLIDLSSTVQRQSSLLGEQKLQIQQQLEIIDQERADNALLKQTLLATEQQLSKIKSAAENTLSILDRNRKLEATMTELVVEKDRLSAENLKLKDSTKMNYLIRGAIISLVAFLIGIVITRIRWRKQDGWGSY